jgi:ADP-ribose pyrophosphatase YjhB (NUDIX family)
MNKTNSCNNCGKHGHLFHQCKLPITSYGIILFRPSDKGIQYLMIRRKDSFGYIDLIRGKYSSYNVDQIQKSVDEMSVAEKERLKTESFDKLWKMLWGDNNGIQYRGEEVASSKKFEIIRNGIQSDIRTTGDAKTSADVKVTLSDIIQNSKTSWEETEWEFPKGRRNFQEKDLECALREFEEETGYSSKDIIVIENLLPFEEIFIGSNHKSYKHKYFLAYMNETVDNLQNYQKTEVSKMEWKTIDQCLEAIRPYNLEKKQLISNINTVLQEYRLYS